MITAFWDIDGTLVRSPKGRADLFGEAVAALGVQPVAPTGPRDGFTDRRLAEVHLAAAGLAPSRVDEYLEVLDRLSVEFYGHTPREPVPGAREALLLTQQAGWRNGLLTGNTPLRARTKLRTSGFDLDAIDWDCFASGGYVSDRAELGRQARVLAGDGPLVVLGDTAQDALAARAAQASFVAVNTDPAVLATIADQAVLAVSSLASKDFIGFVHTLQG
ncbi:MAG: haloacid dehalogenase-like hydrolase [Micropruina sp.]|uniref:HAD family hydrolase n=1 Tax=Micropruina sp. TaxID=2737536 RepID=UPI0039E3B26E